MIEGRSLIRSREEFQSAPSMSDCMINRHRIPLAVAAVIMLAAACTESIDRRIVLADSLSIAFPDSAMKIMDRIDPAKEGFTKQQAMRYELIRAKVQNRAYVDFTTDSVMREVADYYDRHGTANDRVLAHYLLGCTYRDMKEAPMSLQCYYDAVEAADTLSGDCDYCTLMSIWGQIAMILADQYMPMEELEAWKHYQRYALDNHDSLNYIVGIESQFLAYKLLGDTINALRTTDEASRLFHRQGYRAQSVRALYYQVPIYLMKQDYNQVARILRKYESEFDCYDENGNVRKGLELLYGEFYKFISCDFEVCSEQIAVRKEGIMRA